MRYLYKILIITIFLFSLPIVNVSCNSNKSYEYPTKTWIIESQDYFGNFIEWFIYPVDGLNSNKQVWNFTWQIKDFIEFENDIIENPIHKLKNAYNKNTDSFNESVLLNVYNSISSFQFKNYGDFVSDTYRLTDYPIRPEDIEDFNGLIKRIDIFNNNTGSFIVSFKDQWKPNKKITMGFSSTITYSGVTNVITCEGGSIADPITFWDVWNASNVNGWGVVFRKTNHSYVFDASLYIDDNVVPATYFRDENKLVTFDNNTIIFVLRYGNLTLGRLEEILDMSTSHGVSLFTTISGFSNFINMNPAYGTAIINLYGCTVIGLNNNAGITIGRVSRAWNILLVGANIGIADRGSWSRVTIMDSIGLYRIGVGQWEDVSVYSPTYTIYRPLVSVYNIKSINSTWDFNIFNPPSDLLFTNCDLENWSFQWVASAYNIYRLYTMNVKVVNNTGFPLIGAIVTLYDSDNTLIFSEITQSSGYISEQLVIRGYYNITMGQTIVDSSPHRLVVSYNDLNDIIDNITLTDRIDWTVSLSGITPINYNNWIIGVFIAIPLIVIALKRSRR